MKKEKRILSALLALCMVLSLLTGTVMALGEISIGTCGAQRDNLNWVLKTGEMLTISGTGDMADWDRLKSSPAPWDEFSGEIRQITIGDGVTSIGDQAFEWCTSLTKITIPDSVTNIGSYAFAWCTSLTEIAIPNNVTSIGDNAFWQCTSLTEITIPDSVTNIGWGAFFDCGNLTEITIPSSVTSIDDGVFYNCFSLTDVYYSGTEAEWGAVTIKDGNDPLRNAKIHYSDEDIGGDSSAPTAAFDDVQAGAYYADAVAWAVERGITTGTSATAFSPNVTCTQGQILTFLWRAKGEPAPAGAVSGTQFYATAAQWAKEQGLTDDFSANAPCTRAMVVTYLWKLAGSPKPASSGSFTDVPATLADAVDWAAEQKITTGTSATTFSPDTTCTRGQIVTFLYRDMAE